MYNKELKTKTVLNDQSKTYREVFKNQRNILKISLQTSCFKFAWKILVKIYCLLFMNITL